MFEPIKRCALPLHHEVLPMDLQWAYGEAYPAALIAPQIEQTREYQAQFLPFLTLLDDSQRDTIMATVKMWQNELETLK